MTEGDIEIDFDDDEEPDIDIVEEVGAEETVDTSSSVQAPIVIDPSIPPIWNYFTKVAEGAKCKLCGIVVSINIFMKMQTINEHLLISTSNCVTLP